MRISDWSSDVCSSDLAVTLPALCEFCWVLRKVYRYEAARVAASVRLLIDAGNVAADRQAVEAGLAILEQGGDFADGVIAHDGQWLGGETFVSFDRGAVGLLAKHGQAAMNPRSEERRVGKEWCSPCKTRGASA